MAFEKILGDIIQFAMMTGGARQSSSEREWILYCAFVRRLVDNEKDQIFLLPTDAECEAALAVRERLIDEVCSAIQSQ